MEFLIALAIGGLLYFIPAIVAESRKHRNKSAILILNLLLGWTFLGWVIALVWAFTDNVHPEEQSRSTTVPGAKKL